MSSLEMTSSIPGSRETSLKSDVAQLRMRHSDATALNRAVCELLFFKYGISPTVNHLFALVRAGSADTSSMVLQEFWAGLREHRRATAED